MWNVVRIACACLAVGAIGEFVHADEGETQGEASQNSGKIDVNSVFGRFGYATTSKIDQKSCQITLKLDQKAFIEKVPMLQAMQLLNPDITQTKINTEPTVLSMAFSLNMAPVAIKEVYDENPGVDRCSFRQNVAVVDDYGNDRDEWFFSFAFSRQLYKRINWDKFPPQNLMKIAPEFRFNPVVMMKANNESGSQ
ncbi:MAG: hypothetical protein JO047_02270 [Alphaproteobacteria bacterium]|nr:hypothetical protein [Alphaproteobacteria bacterium]